MSRGAFATEAVIHEAAQKPGKSATGLPYSQPYSASANVVNPTAQLAGPKRAAAIISRVKRCAVNALAQSFEEGLSWLCRVATSTAH